MIKTLFQAFLALILLGFSLTGLQHVSAQGGVVTQPYWVFEAEARVNIIRTADTDGDGSQEIALGAEDNWLYLLEADGRLAWSYEASSPIASILLSDLDADGQAEIVAGLRDGAVNLLQPGQGAVWTYTGGGAVNGLAPADLDGNGYSEILAASADGKVYALDTQGRLLWSCDTGRAVVGISAADVDGDGRPEIIPNPMRGNAVWALQADGSLAWRKQAESEVGLVDSGDLDGDGQSEIVLFSAAFEITAWDGDGHKLWDDEGIAHAYAHDHPEPGQMSLADLDGDGRVEIVVISRTRGLIYVLRGDGRPLWQHPFSPRGGFPRLQTGDANHDGQTDILVATSASDPIRLLNANGSLVSEYRTESVSRALAYTDLNGDGRGEVLVGTLNGLEVFGASDEVTTARIWEAKLGSPPTALALGDVDGDSASKVVAGTQDGRVVALTYDNETLADIAVEAPVVALALGDVDGDGRDEVVAATWGGLASEGGGQIQLLASGKRMWAIPAGAYATDVAVRDLTGDGGAEIIIAYGLAAGGSAIAVLDIEGHTLWQRELAEQAVIVGSLDGHVLAGTASGRIYPFTADGAPLEPLELARPIIAMDGSLAVTADGQVHQFSLAPPKSATIFHSTSETLEAVAIAGSNLVLATAGGRVSHLTIPASAAPEASQGGTIVWETTLDEQVASLAVGDLNGDGQVEIAVGTRRGRVILFGPVANQPPYLTNPALLAVGSGYSYSVHVNDPDQEMVRVILEIWDPSQKTWRADRGLALEDGVGLLNWSVPNAFDTWDAGRDSKFRFVYDDGHTLATTNETPGPFSISTTPWYVYYGSRIGLAALILAIPALGLIFHRRQQAYRRSPVGQAEALLEELRGNPAEALSKLHAAARETPVLLGHLPGLASQGGEKTIAELSEGFRLILSRPDVAAEGLRAVVEASRLAASQDIPAAALVRSYDVYLQTLDAKTVSGIVALRPQLESLGEMSPREAAPAAAALGGLGRVAQTLRNYEQVETVEDKVAYLAQAIETLGRLDREFQASAPQPERTLLTRIAAHWLALAANALSDLQGRAQLQVSLETRQILSLDQATLSLELTNTGRSPASNVTVALIPSPQYTVASSVVCVEILPSRHAASVHFSIAGLPAADHIRAEFEITFDDREQSGKTLAFADRVRLLKPPAAFQPIPNPYAPGTPLRPGSATFFGRKDLFQFIAENMAGLARQNIFVLIGQRRIGKTSFLQQLPAQLGEEYLPVYIDGQSLGIDPGMPNFFYDLSLSIVDALDDQAIDMPEPGPEVFLERPSRTFEHDFLPAVFEAIGKRQLLLLFDEFEELEMRVASGKLEATIFPFFRHLMQHGGNLGFIFVGTHRLEALSSDYWSIFFNIALYKQITFLDKQAARKLIVEPVAAHGLLYDDLALDKILRVTAGHPYFLQLTCHALVNHVNRERRGYMTIQDVNDVLEEMVELGEAHFAFLWEQSSLPERLALASLTRLLSLEPTVTALRITELLSERGAAVGARETTEALRQLVTRGIVREVDGQPLKYEYKLALMRLWVERYKTLGRVIEEVEYVH